jgi:hypothetical protein
MATDLFSFLMAMVPGAQHGNVTTEICNALTNSWVQLALIAIPCIVFVAGRRYNMLVSFLSIPASICILRYTTEGISVPDCYADKLSIFVGGFFVIAAVNVYYHLVKD